MLHPGDLLERFKENNRAKLSWKLPQIFSLACNLLKLDAYSNYFQLVFLLRILVSATRSAQKRQLLVYQRPDIKDNDKKYQLVRCYNVLNTVVAFGYKKSLRRVKMVSLTQVPVRTSLRRLKLVSFVYIQVRHRIYVWNRSVLLKYQLRRCDDDSAYSWSLITKMGQFLLSTSSNYIFSTPQVD